MLELTRTGEGHKAWREKRKPTFKGAEMDLALTEPQEMLRTSARRSSSARALAHDRALQKRTRAGAGFLAKGVEAGWLGILAPPSTGEATSS